MSRPQTKQPSLMTWIWIFATVWLGINLLTNRPQQDKRTPDQQFQAVVDNVKLIKSTSTSQGKSIKDVVAAMGTNAEVSAPHPAFSSDQDYQQMLLMNELGLDQSINTVNADYQSKVADLATKRLITPDQRAQKELAGDILVADSAFRSAKERQEIQRIIVAQDTLTHLGRQYDQKPIWNQPFQLAPTKEYPDSTVTPSQLRDRVATLAEKLGKDTPVWGFFPGYWLIDSLVHLSGAAPAYSYALAALLLAICVRAIIYPLSQRQMMWSRQMSQLTPLANEIRAQYKDKKQDQKTQNEMNARIMELYKEYGINPLAGCLPAVLQMPLFLIVYQSMLHYRFEFQKGLFLWINPGTASLTNGFTARNLGEKDYILLILYGITMVTTTLLTPVSDPTNARQARMMGISISLVFSVMMFFWPVPSAFVLYWVFTNILATAQSLRSYRLPLPPLVKKNTVVGGVYPTNGQAVAALNGKNTATGVPQRHKAKKKKK